MHTKINTQKHLFISHKKIKNCLHTNHKAVDRSNKKVDVYEKKFFLKFKEVKELKWLDNKAIDTVIPLYHSG